MEWDGRLALGIEEIDDQHRALLEKFAAVHSLIAADAKLADIRKAIAQFLAFAKWHFDFEEGLMGMYGYPGRNEHCERHLALSENVIDLERCLLRRTPGVCIGDLENLAYAWLEDHVLVDDRKLVDFILAGAAVVRSVPAAGGG